jgi:hypothetical protein
MPTLEPHELLDGCPLDSRVLDGSQLDSQALDSRVLDSRSLGGSSLGGNGRCSVENPEWTLTSRHLTSLGTIEYVTCTCGDQAILLEGELIKTATERLTDARAAQL